MDDFLFLNINCIIILLIFLKETMKKGSYEQPRITIYEVETTAILAGSGKQDSVPNKQSFSLDRESEELTSGDGDGVWE
ncbi:hypothetical protein HMPREF0673_02570 [Leyella stercorea DSM 18206]|uniref:Uncharacterized protein n=2 Tax=Leyella stercorea TaxID=363265 RepID=G6B102_9BACT|nr:hypothetical protein HMPREF0673_02570 [Leyella stercorea DSM 18206]